ncbi:serine hydrolase domain-containing protein [Allokutzneria oryzae]|uniref:Serine hydrolase domain-containing protein n=1 Tax=Allokutzneria oryzae TaxID=1378989 RepID=A0ABV5ZRN2_9PSEU
MTFDLVHWQARLDELRAAHHVPGASLAVLSGGEIHELASGVLHRGTGVEATTDSVFQLGSVAKVHTATLVMQLVDSGELDLDGPVVSVLPEFRVADAEATKTITVRQLLTHTSGISGDFTLDTGRGDDCLARYVDACAEVGQDFPPGTAISYSSTGYNVLGRIVEVLTGQTWDDALKDRLLTPLGLTNSVTLPEDVLRFRAAMGHTDAGEPMPAWTLIPRSGGPYGGVLCAGAGDVVRLARMHLDGGAGLLSESAVTEMQRHAVDVPDKWTVSSDGWGLGWTLYDWDGVPGYGHDGAATGQYSYLRVVPGAGVAVALLTNGGGARQLCTDLFRELLGELAGVRMPAPFAPAPGPSTVDFSEHVGVYQREGVRITVSQKAGAPHLVYEFIDGMAHFSPPLEVDLKPVSENVFAAPGTGAFSDDWMPVVFFTLSTGTSCVYVGLRATPRMGKVTGREGCV